MHRQKFYLKYSVLLCVYIFFVNICSANNAIYTKQVSKSFGVKEGLPQIQITYLFRDKKGFLWIGTREGIARWDGKTMMSFVNEDNVKYYPQQVESIQELEDGFIFVLYTIRNGMLKYAIINGNKPKYYFYEIPVKENIKTPIQTKVTFVNNNLIRFNFQMDSSIHICEFDRAKNNFSLKKTIRNVVQLHLAYKDYILYSKSTLDSNVLNFQGVKNDKLIESKRINISSFQSFHFTNIQSMCLKGEQYISFKNQKIYNFQIDKNFHFFIDSFKPPIFINEQDRFRFTRNGYIYNQENIQSIIFDNKGLVSFQKMDIIWDFLKDAQGNLYVGTEHGMNCIYNSGVEEVLFKDNFKLENVIFINKNSKNSFFFSSYSDGIYSFDGSLKKNRILIAGFKSNEARGPVVSNKFGDIVYPFVENDKIPVSVNSKLKLYPFPYKGAMYGIKRNPYTNDIYLSIGANFIKFDAKTKEFVNLSTNSKIKGKLIYDFDFLKNGNVILKSELNVLLLDNNKVSVLNKELEYGWSVLVDEKESIWCSEGKMLSEFHNDKKTILKNLKVNSMIIALTQVKNKLIIGTLNELIFFDLDIWRRTGGENYVTYTVNDVLNINEGNDNNFFVENDSILYWPCLDKILKFNVNKLVNFSKVPPQVSFVEYVYYNEKERISVFDSFLQKDFHVLSRFRNIEIKFACPAFLNHDNIQFRYRIKPNASWIYLKSNEQLRIIDIAPGTYQFEVQASFDGILWNQSEKSLPIVFQPRFYETFMFWAFLILTLAFSGYFILKYFLQKLKIKQEAELKEKVEKNSLSLQVIKSKYIPHFTFNAMTSINYLLRKEEIKKASAYLIKITDLQRIALSNFDNPETMLETELKFLSHYLSLEGLRFEDTLSYKISVGKNVERSIMVPNLCIHTMVENAIKHGLYNKPDGNWKLSVYVIQLKDKLLISVEDNGLGLAKANENKIHSTGTGLKMLKRQLNILSNVDKKYTYRLSDIYDSKGQIRGARSSIFITFY